MKNSDLLWTLIIIFLIIFFIYLIFLFFFTPTAQFGEYGEIIQGQCVNESGLCADPATRTNIQNCIINLSTGKGCIGLDGLQTFDAKLYVEPCSLTCRSAIWEDITVDRTCVAPPDPDDPSQDPALPGQCLPRVFGADNNTYLGTRTLIYECVAHDPSGINSCTGSALMNVIGPTGTQGQLPLLKTYQVGDIVTIEEQCDPIQTNPFCGYWTAYTDLDYQDGTTIDDNDVTSCNWSNNFLLSEDCVVEGGNSAFNIFKEGLFYQPMLCLRDDQTGILPSVPFAMIHDCLQTPANINCNVNEIYPNNLYNNTVNPDIINNNFICAEEFNISAVTDNPVCVKACRLYPTSQTTLPNNPEFNVLINNPFLMLNNNHYVTVNNLPALSPGVYSPFTNQYEPNNNFPSSQVATQVTDLLAVPENFLINGPRENCTDEDLVFNTSLLANFSFTEELPVEANKIIVRLQINAPPSFTGWFENENNNPTWNQQKGQYLGPGLQFNDVETILLELLSPFVSGAVPGYPGSIGTMRIRLANKDGSSFNSIGLVTGGVMNFFDDMTIIIFDHENFNYNSRADLSVTSCNLFIDTN